MNSVQKEIITLLQEIDIICKKHNINYYSAGGTTIGAIRHNGFIPWDDDADIYMTRKDYNRFLEILDEEIPHGSVFDSYDTNKDSPSVIGRYMNEGSTAIFRTNILGKVPNGQIIDIFVLDPVPADKDLQREHLQNLLLLNNLINPYYVMLKRPVTHERFKDNPYELIDTEKYKKYKKMYKSKGRIETLDTLYSEITKYDEDECDYYALRWGFYLHIFDKKMFEKPVYYHFEDMEMPCPDFSNQYLRQLYNDRWMDIPVVQEEQQQHIAIMDPEISYKFYREDYMHFINTVKAENKYWKRQEKRIEILYEREFLFAKESELQAIKTKMALNHRIKEKNIKQIFKRKKYFEIIDLFADYYAQQLKTPIFTYREFIKIDDEELYIAAYALIYIGLFYEADKILTLRENDSEKLSSELMELKELVAGIKLINDYIFEKQFEEAKTELVKHEKKYDDILDLKKARIVLELEEASKDNGLYDDIKKYILFVLKGDFSYDGELIKYLGDTYYETGHKEEAYTFYKQAVASTTNGLLLADINAKFEDLDYQYFCKHYKSENNKSGWGYINKTGNMLSEEDKENE